MTTKSTSLRGSLTLVSLALLGLAVVSLACSSDAGGSTDPDANVPTIDAAAVDTWDSYASGFFEAYCSECHGPGDALRDYSLLESVQGEESKIRCGVSPESITGCSIPARQFPIGSGAMPSDEERTRLVQWLNDGAQ